MSNKLKFGNGQWATKDGSALAYNDENGNFKPLPFDFTRASKATVINKNGLIEEVGSGQPRIDFLGNTKGAMLLEPSSTNLITQSEAFGSSYWSKSGATIEGDASTTGAEKVVNGDFSSGANWTILSGTTISGGVANINQSGTVQLMYNSLSVTANTFYKVSFEIKNYVSGTCAVSFAGYGFQIAATSNGVFTAYANSFANGPLFIYSSSGFVGSIDNVSVKEVQGFSAPSVDSPLGAFKLVASTTTDYISATAISTGNNNITVSYFVKADTLSNFSIVEAFYFGTVTNFDLSLETSDNGKIEKIGNGWYRCSKSYVYGAGQTIIATQLKTNAIGSIYIFGAQVEAGSYPTSYIKTEGSTVTRLGETCNNGGNDQVINSTEGVLYYEASYIDGSDYNSISLSNNSGSEKLRTWYDGDNLVFANFVNNVNQTFIGYPISKNINYKIAVRYKLNDFALYVNGSKSTNIVVNLGGVSPQNSYNKLNLNSGDIYNKFYGDIKDLRVYNTALTDAELQTLTTI